MNARAPGLAVLPCSTAPLSPAQNPVSPGGDTAAGAFVLEARERALEDLADMAARNLQRRNQDQEVRP